MMRCINVLEAHALAIMCVNQCIQASKHFCYHVVFQSVFTVLHEFFIHRCSWRLNEEVERCSNYYVQHLRLPTIVESSSVYNLLDEIRLGVNTVVACSIKQRSR